MQLGLKPKIPDQRKQLDYSEFMFRNKPGHIAGNKCKQEPDANYSFVPFLKERANEHFVPKSSYVYTCFEYLKGAKRRTPRLGVVNSILTTH